ncbi:MAG: serine hydrolase domain-containing protein [Acidobacteriota bacterium]
MPRPRCAMSAFVMILLLAASAPAFQSSTGLSQADPESIGLDSGRLSRIDETVQAAIRRKELPGAVVLVARHGRIGYVRAFGNRALKPRDEPMTIDTIFDMASLTKVMATAPSVMILVQDGQVRLGDRVKRYLPGFTGGGKDDITVRMLLTHHSGLRPDFDLSTPWEGYAAALAELWKENTESKPGTEFKYSDLNFIALGEIVRAVSGKDLDAFAQERIYQPLGMADTGFRSPDDKLPRIAPTESRARSLAYLKGEASGAEIQEILRGRVHDPTAWRMGGTAGHAGLFSSARDVALYAQMLLNEGVYGDRRVFAPATVRAMTSSQSPKQSASVRGFGWDIDTSYSAPRGDLFEGGFGHTGFTGTSLWIHPPSATFVLILSNRVHPDGSGDVTHLRGAVANIVAAAIRDGS